MIEGSGPIEKRVTVNGISLCYFEWGQEAAHQPTILLVHATGFHARCFDAVIALLPGFHIIALDMRGHGRSDKSPPIEWAQFGLDLAGFVRSLSLSNLVAAGHSMGGHSLVQAAAAEQHRFRSLVLVDPVILAPEAYAVVPAWRSAAEHPVARRKHTFASPAEFRKNLEGRGSFALWEPRVLRDYCDFGVLPRADGAGYELACPPLVEATIYLGSTSHNILSLPPGINLPVTVLRALERGDTQVAVDFSKSPTWPGLAALFPKGEDVYLPHLSHFIPMQAPGVLARYLQDHVSQFEGESR